MATTPPATASPLVIVVDDDEDTRLNLSDILELDGYRVELAASARELLARQNWDDVSLVLLDRKLPDGSPQELVPLIRDHAPQAAIIVVPDIPTSRARLPPCAAAPPTTS
jgi:DNA-binding NtrC family response regulator